MITIGTDPEAFVVNREGNVDIAVGTLGGSKTAPRTVPGGAVQEDNVLAEFNTEPADTAEEFVNAINSVVLQVERLLRFSGLTLLFKPSHVFDAATLERGGEQALEFGCDPDFNAYTGEENRKPDNSLLLRTAGGHVHIGYDDIDEDMNQRIVMACDILLGIPSVVLDQDQERRKMYGTAGCFRHQPHGVEYRSLSNFWLQSDDLKRWVFEQARASVHAASSLEEMWEQISPDEIQRIINTGDVGGAQQVVNTLGIRMPGV